MLCFFPFSNMPIQCNFCLSNVARVCYWDERHNETPFLLDLDTTKLKPFNSNALDSNNVVYKKKEANKSLPKPVGRKSNAYTP